jgi:hypothetical protein
MRLPDHSSFFWKRVQLLKYRGSRTYTKIPQAMRRERLEMTMRLIANPPILPVKKNSAVQLYKLWGVGTLPSVISGFTKIPAITSVAIEARPLPEFKRKF